MKASKHPAIVALEQLEADMLREVEGQHYHYHLQLLEKQEGEGPLPPPRCYKEYIDRKCIQMWWGE